jgi:ribonuclease BN (tRNA processing enzyme)
VRVQFLGTGDAFGSGGRLQTCFHVTASTTRFLIDCGASALISMRRFGVDPNDIDTVFLTHLHGDHFAGLPFLILDAQFVSRRRRGLVIAGPEGLRRRLSEMMESEFPGSWAADRPFAVHVEELPPETRTVIGSVAATPFPVRHPSGAASYALRLEVDGRIIAYSGDTEWVDTLIAAGREADLFIAEAYTYDRRIPNHLDWVSLAGHLGEIRPRRLVLTHMSQDMLARPRGSLEADLQVDRAEDGLIIEI